MYFYNLFTENANQYKGNSNVNDGEEFSLLLNKAALEKFTYSFFRGLKYNNRFILKNNIGRAVEYLIDNPDALKKMQDIQSNILTQNIVIRGFYWIFNIQNYRRNFYKLAAYELYQDYSNYIRSIFERESTQNVYLIKKSCEFSPWKEFKDEYLDILKLHKIEVVEVKEGAVNQVIAYCLKFLNLADVPVEELTISKIKSAYRKLSRIYHPDKGGEPEEFIFIGRVVEVLEKYVEDPDSVRDELNITSSFSTDICIALSRRARKALELEMQRLYELFEKIGQRTQGTQEEEKVLEQRENLTEQRMSMRLRNEELDKILKFLRRDYINRMKKTHTDSSSRFFNSTSSNTYQIYKQQEQSPNLSF